MSDQKKPKVPSSALSHEGGKPMQGPKHGEGRGQSGDQAGGGVTAIESEQALEQARSEGKLGGRGK